MSLDMKLGRKKYLSESLSPRLLRTVDLIKVYLISLTTQSNLLEEIFNNSSLEF